MKTYEHTTTGIRVEATDIDHACELIEAEMGVDDAGRSTGARERVEREDVEEVVPRLYIRRGRTLIEVTPVQASRLMEAARLEAEKSNYGYRKVKDIQLCNIDGVVIGHVSFNGRVWIHGPGDWKTNVEIPLPGVRTARECEAEGWR